MRYKIFKSGEHINTIIASEEFCKKYYSTDGYSYELEELEPAAEPEPEITELEQLRADVDYIAIMSGVEL